MLQVIDDRTGEIVATRPDGDQFHRELSSLYGCIEMVNGDPCIFYSLRREYEKLIAYVGDGLDGVYETRYSHLKWW